MITNTAYLILIVIFILFILICGFYKRIKYPEISFEIAFQNKTIFNQYLSRYCITNMKFTLLCVILYILGKISIILYLRITCLSLINQTTILDIFPLDLESVKSSMKFDFIYLLWPLIIKLILFVISFTLFNVLLDRLFFQQILKMHIFLRSIYSYNYILHIFRKEYSDIIKKLTLFFYNIANLRYQSSEEEGYLDFAVYKDIYENKFILQLSKLCVDLAKKFKVVFWIFIQLNKLFIWLFMRIHFEYIIPQIAILLYFSAIFYDIIHLKLYYTLYALIIIYLIRLIIQIKKFAISKNGIIDLALSNFFYDSKNESHFNQRNTLHTNIGIKYILNKFQQKYDYSEESLLITKRVKKIYKRLTAICINMIFLLYFVFKHDIYIISIEKYNIEISFAYLLLMINIIIIIVSRKIFYLKANPVTIDMYAEYEYNKKYNMIFWLFILISNIICISIIIKATLQISLDNILWNLYYLKIIRYYTLIEKTNFLHKYIKQFIKSIPMFKDDVDDIHFKAILINLQEYLEFKHLKIDFLTVKELKILAIRLVQMYYRVEKSKIITHPEIHRFIEGIRNGIFGYIIWSYAFTYSKAIYLAHHFFGSRTQAWFEIAIKYFFTRR